MSKTRECGEHAAFRFTWAGRPESHACIVHGAQLATVAQAMGYPLQLIPLGVSALDPPVTTWPTCKNQVPVAVETTHKNPDPAGTRPEREPSAPDAGGAAGGAGIPVEGA